jgi:hypothetical protein
MFLEELEADLLKSVRHILRSQSRIDIAHNMWFDKWELIVFVPHLYLKSCSLSNRITFCIGK